MAAPRLRLTIKDLPPDFITTAEVEARTGRKVRSVRNDCLEEDIALMVVRPCGGLEHAVHARGHAALRRGDNPGDTGDLADGRRIVATFAQLAVGLFPGDTGPLDAARRAVANLAAGDTG